jgi:hypothetical protein
LQQVVGLGGSPGGDKEGPSEYPVPRQHVAEGLVEACDVGERWFAFGGKRMFSATRAWFSGTTRKCAVANRSVGFDDAIFPEEPQRTLGFQGFCDSSAMSREKQRNFKKA